jgi:hypothetical protein
MFLDFFIMFTKANITNDAIAGFQVAPGIADNNNNISSMNTYYWDVNL